MSVDSNRLAHFIILLSCTLVTVFAFVSCDDAKIAKKVRLDQRGNGSVRNESLGTIVAEKKFREDLFYRINTMTISIPPLRERQDDIPLLADYFLKRYRTRLGKDIRGITEETMEAFRRHPWPGNVRQLENTIHKAVIMCDNASLSLECCVELPEQDAGPACL